jgi:hypothetical protein
VFHRSWRTATAALPLAGVLLAAGIAGPAFTGLGTAQGLAFLAVAVASIGLAVAVLRGARWAVATGAVLLGAQLGAVVGTIWELTGGIAASKADILRQLDVSPIAGLLVNLAYFDRVGGLRWPVRCGPRVGRRAGWVVPAVGAGGRRGGAGGAGHLAGAAVGDPPPHARRRRPRSRLMVESGYWNRPNAWSRSSDG